MRGDSDYNHYSGNGITEVSNRSVATGTKIE